MKRYVLKTANRKNPPTNVISFIFRTMFCGWEPEYRDWREGETIDAVYDRARDKLITQSSDPILTETIDWPVGTTEAGASKAIKNCTNQQ